MSEQNFKSKEDNLIERHWSWEDRAVAPWERERERKREREREREKERERERELESKMEKYDLRSQPMSAQGIPLFN